MDQQLLIDWVGYWPGVSHEIKWQDDLAFMVGGKMFLRYCFQGKNRGQCSFKVEDGRLLEFTDRPHIVPAPYLARTHWISLLPGCAMASSEKQALIRCSYELVRTRLTKAAQRALIT